MPRITPKQMHATQTQRFALRRRLIEIVEKKRQELGYKKSTFCQLSGIPAENYARIFNGGGEKITIDALVLSLLRLGCNVDFVVTEIKSDGGEV